MMKITRRQTMGFMGGVAALPLIGCEERTPNSMPDYFSGDALYSDVKYYAGLGIHRTGTKVDHQVTDWMADHLDSLGFDVTRLPFQVRQFFPDTVSLEVGDRLLDLDKDIGPQWPVTPLPAPLTAPLIDLTDGKKNSPAGGPGSIVIIDQHMEPPTSPEAQAALEAAYAFKPAAIIAIGKSETGRIWYGNYHHDTPLFDVPVILAGRKDRDFLKTAAASGTDATLTLTGKVDPSATAYNVIAKLDRGSKPMVISTPQSGWTSCAGERGPGIAYFRALARWAATSDEAAKASFVFVCNSGHEIWNHGAHESIEAGLIPEPEDTAFWLHLGANIGVYDFEGLIDEGRDGARKTGPINKTYGMAPEALVPDVAAHFKKAGSLVVSHETFNVGEMEEIVAAGYDPAVGFVGANIWHHIPGDTAETLGPEPLGAMGRGFLGLVRDRL